MTLIDTTFILFKFGVFVLFSVLICMVLSEQPK
jgi:hypothetical protein